MRGRLDEVSVMDHFRLICSVPHGSGDTKALKDLLKDRFSANGLTCLDDAHGNMLVRRPASKGREEEETLVLQAHLDMVAVKKSDCALDLQKDHIILKEEDGTVSADGTSLGADNGLGVALMAAILDDPEISAPALECLFTNDEEIGLLGASAFDAGLITGRRMINLDSEKEGECICGCAGGVRAHVKIPVRRYPGRMCLGRILISGLKGGHSGDEIDKGRANAAKLLARLTSSLRKKAEISLVSLDGGEKDNAIMDSSFARIGYDPSRERMIEDEVRNAEKLFREEYLGTDDGISVTFTPEGMGDGSFLEESSFEDVLDLLELAPCGVLKMSGVSKGLPETSANVGVVKSGEDGFEVTISLRSALGESLEYEAGRLETLAGRCNGTVCFKGHYPPWGFRSDSLLREKASEVYKRLTGRELEVKVIHAGLECGIFASKIPGLDVISLGPDIYDIHTVNEHFEKESLASFVRFIGEFLSERY